MFRNGHGSSLTQVLVIGLIFDVCLLSVVVAHIRYVAKLSGQIMAMEGSVDIVLHSQTELYFLLAKFLSNKSQIS